jgi:TolB-like protein/Tfp pilus assembly protein PilF
MSLFSELKRRNVFRVGLAYLVSAWIIAQVASLVLSSFKAPDWVIQALLLLLGLGFIVALVISWAYELTPDGLKRDADVTADASMANQTAKKLNYITIVAAVAVLGLFIYQQMSPSTTVANDATLITQGTDTNAVIDSTKSQTIENSIAVLPFVDMSQAGDQEYFADGISEEILNVIVRIPTLKVAGRTSSFSFKGKNEDLRVIGESLGVNHILEGSVRRSNMTLRITAQLIRSEDGFHLWSETYDREIADIFDIQDEIAQKVADQLVISMGLELKTKEHNRTTDLVVYEDYLQAKQLFVKRGRENLDKALALVDHAITRDPNYAPAWTLKAIILGVYGAYVDYEEALENFIKWDSESKYAAEKALELDPNSAEAYLVLGNVYFNSFDFIQAFQNYNRAIELAPDNPIILDALAQNFLDVGYFEKSKTMAEKAVGIDPLVAMYRNSLGRANRHLGFDAEANKNFEKSIALDPSLGFGYNNLLYYYFTPETSTQFQAVEARRSAQKIGRNNSGLLQTFTLIQNNGALENRTSVQRLREETDSEDIKWFLSNYLGDTDSVIELLEPGWSQKPRLGLNHYPFGTTTGLFSNARWKEQVRKDGMLALWQTNGFPAHCKPIDKDDFECDEPKRSK